MQADDPIRELDYTSKLYSEFRDQLWVARLAVSTPILCQLIFIAVTFHAKPTFDVLVMSIPVWGVTMAMSCLVTWFVGADLFWEIVGKRKFWLMWRGTPLLHKPIDIEESSLEPRNYVVIERYCTVVRGDKERMLLKLTY